MADETGVLAKPPANRKPWQRLTFWGAVLIAGANAAEMSGGLPVGTVQHAVGALEAVGQLLALFGVYRHVAN